MQRGFTLIELAAVMAIAGTLAAVSYPSYTSNLRKARRADAISYLASIQQSQENWRANHSEYGSLSELGLSADSGGPSYILSISDTDPRGYVATAQARGAQLGDEACRFMRLTLLGGNTLRTSGADELVANGMAANSQCWIR